MRSVSSAAARPVAEELEGVLGLVCTQCAGGRYSCRVCAVGSVAMVREAITARVTVLSRCVVQATVLTACHRHVGVWAGA